MKLISWNMKCRTDNWKVLADMMDEHEADVAMVQEAVARTLKRHRLAELTDPAAYLRRTILNLASNHRRGLARRRRAQSLLSRDAAVSSDSYPSDLSDLAAVPTHERAVLYLSEVEGYRYAEIAQMLGCSESAARTRALRGRRRLGVALEQEASDD